MLALSECVVALPSQKAPQNSNSISNGTLPLSWLGWEQRVGEMAKRVLVKSGLFGEGGRSGVLDSSSSFSSPRRGVSLQIGRHF